VAPIDLLKALKLSCKDHLNKPKHAADLRVLEDVELSDEMLDFVKLRSIETRIRVEKQQELFFNRYQIRRTIPHDQLHKMITDAPVYEALLIDAVTPSKAKFDSLPEAEQAKAVYEEVMVLTLERHVLSQPTPLHKHAALAASANFLSAAPQYWLTRLGTNMNDNPGWFRDWITAKRTMLITRHAQIWSDMHNRASKALS
jgi:hypothetical protein